MSNDTTRVTITLEVTVPKGQTPRDVREWFTKHLDYFHPSMKPSLVKEVQAPADDEDQGGYNPEDML